MGKTPASDADARSILDGAIKALGGEEKLTKAVAFSWESTGSIIFNADENEITTDSSVFVEGIDHFRRDYFNESHQGTLLLNGDEGQRRFGQVDDEGNEFEPLVAAALANEKRNAYLQVIPITLVPLKGDDFRCEAAGEERVGNRSAFILKVTGPDGKEFMLYFDKKSGVPIRQVAKVIDSDGKEYTAEISFAEYKVFDGIRKATKLRLKRDGKKFQHMEVIGFKVLDKLDLNTFAEVT